ncbi:MAG: YlxR family protein [Anaerolineales bacterium]|jgi:predicted RNA-binding protein YlxR (DUF448 family)
MSQKKAASTKHVPTRTCVGCRETIAKRSLIRIVRGPDGIRVDPSGKASGRGAYLHQRRECWENALRGPLEQALKTDLTPDERDMLVRHMNQLPPDDGKPSGSPHSAGGIA